VIEAVPRESLELNDITQIVVDLRALDDRALTALPGAVIRVGGLPAINADYIRAIRSHFVPIVAAVVGTTLVFLMIAFRSVLVPVKAVALNLLSVAAAYGAVVLVFQDGHGARFIGLDAPLAGVFPTVPLLAFCVVFGLSMDYEVFLVSRIREAREGMSEADAVTEGLSRTGGIITSAAAIMIAVFGAFTLGNFVFVKVLGFALAVAVLLDATIVRMALGPALLVLAGRWNWWPGDKSR
jgi:putative drug exporter of the RND superfamily